MRRPTKTVLKTITLLGITKRTHSDTTTILLERAADQKVDSTYLHQDEEPPDHAWLRFQSQHPANGSNSGESASYYASFDTSSNKSGSWSSTPYGNTATASMPQAEWFHTPPTPRRPIYTQGYQNGSFTASSATLCTYSEPSAYSHMAPQHPAYTFSQNYQPRPIYNKYSNEASATPRTPGYISRSFTSFAEAEAPRILQRHHTAPPEVQGRCSSEGRCRLCGNILSHVGTCDTCYPSGHPITHI
ncbi:hypothetical protein BU16DRAFT_536515 [Lophium mytilinum]|uniref:Uncharacterized protein n=1 Tax=Lophium mytilinum TaxID=390894 RepID=A0A6A6R1B8_9PEZI|nr:hypothetical protein BU16DRAFT_536515 [Lophium mytilinum]